ncbi:hypothetical protein SASPL_131519 [Salvia splendens]|uniref:Tr-type G domain-containing protein n=1 Tax=Salvia splendens TaxID=180675 RepID=A0A8X8ZKY0_SALSN|nr:hypothetical protein SASPL_131519 [Salvia splendens]
MGRKKPTARDEESAPAGAEKVATPKKKGKKGGPKNAALNDDDEEEVDAVIGDEEEDDATAIKFGGKKKAKATKSGNSSSFSAFGLLGEDDDVNDFESKEEDNDDDEVPEISFSGKKKASKSKKSGDNVSSAFELLDEEEEGGDKDESPKEEDGDVSIAFTGKKKKSSKGSKKASFSSALLGEDNDDGASVSKVDDDLQEAGIGIGDAPSEIVEPNQHGDEEEDIDKILAELGAGPSASKPVQDSAAAPVAPPPEEKLQNQPAEQEEAEEEGPVETPQNQSNGAAISENGETTDANELDSVEAENVEEVESPNAQDKAENTRTVPQDAEPITSKPVVLADKLPSVTPPKSVDVQKKSVPEGNENDNKKNSANPEKKSKKEVTDDQPVQNEQNLRSPICCIMGHVDTGKTKLLDCIRGTNVQEGEAGGITQQIGATYFPAENIRERTKELKADAKLNVPGLLVIDTPGHESFTNLRSRGSGLCDLAILVVDIMHGLEPQTIESLNLLKMRNTDFLIALNKVERLYGWKSCRNAPIGKAIRQQSKDVMIEFNMRLTQSWMVKAVIEFLMEIHLIGILSTSSGIGEPITYTRLATVVEERELVDEELEDEEEGSTSLEDDDIDEDDYVDLLCGEGVPDLLLLLVQWAQKTMIKRLTYSEEVQCTVLEVKVDEGHETTIDIVLVNGVLREGDQIVVGGMQGPVVTSIRALLTPHPMRELRVKGTYLHHKEIKAAQGIKIAAQIGTPICVPGREFVEIGRIASIENNHRPVDYAKKGQKMAIKIIGSNPEEQQKMAGRHFEVEDELVSKISRKSLDALKENYADDLSTEEKRLLFKLKKLFKIL